VTGRIRPCGFISRLACCQAPIIAHRRHHRTRESCSCSGLTCHQQALRSRKDLVGRLGLAHVGEIELKRTESGCRGSRPCLVVRWSSGQSDELRLSDSRQRASRTQRYFSAGGRVRARSTFSTRHHVSRKKPPYSFFFSIPNRTHRPTIVAFQWAGARGIGGVR
jgi:hypothetical protein